MLYKIDNVKVSYIREHWYEWLGVFVSYGEMRPKFYLPVKRYVDRAGTLNMIIPLAIFVALYFALSSAFYAFWSDCLWALEQWDKDNIK
jgi:hypothetical protein